MVMDTTVVFVTNREKVQMLYGFTIAPSLKLKEPGAEYFASLERAAFLATAQAELTLQHATDLCEYLDCVDAGDLKASQPLYRNAVLILTGYLELHEHDSIATGLANKSWAAKTLVEVMESTKSQVRAITLRRHATV